MCYDSVLSFKWEGCESVRMPLMFLQDKLNPVHCPSCCWPAKLPAITSCLLPPSGQAEQEFLVTVLTQCS